MTPTVRNTNARLPRLLRWMGGTAFVVVLWIMVPPFRIVWLDESGQRPQQEGVAPTFDPIGFVDTFWEEKLMPKLGDATELDQLLPLLAEDPLAAKETFGVHDSRYYFAKGEGRVEAVEGRRALLSVAGESVSLLIAPPVFGNTVRDGTGLLSVNDFSGLEAFNAVSALLNEKVETEVMPSLSETLRAGAAVSFTGCAKAPEAVGDGALLEFIPLQVEVAP